MGQRSRFLRDPFRGATPLGAALLTLLAPSPLHAAQRPAPALTHALPAPDLGPGWRIQPDALTGRMRWAYGRGIPLEVGPAPDAFALEAAARRFIDAHSGDLLIPGDALTLKGLGHAGPRTWVSFQQHVRGIPVEGATVEVRIFAGRVTLFGGRGRPEALGLIPDPRLSPQGARRDALAHHPGGRVIGEADLVYLPQGPRGVALARRVEIAPDGPGPSEILYLAAEGPAVGALIARRPGGHTLEAVATLEREPRTAGDPLVTVPFAFGTVAQGADVSTTDGAGAFSIPGDGAPLTFALEGPYLRVLQADALPTRDVAPSDPHWPAKEADLSALNAWLAVHEARAWALKYAPELDYLHRPELAQVDVPGDACNAYYQSDVGMIFLVGSEDEGCLAFARIADVVYHEYGHGLHHALLLGGSFDDAISEGSADYLAATLTGDPIVGPGAYGPGTFVREVATDRRYPTDLVDQIHTDGLIWAGAMWDLRSAFIDAYGAEAGAALADRLFVTALRGGPSFQDVYVELLFADDDNGDLADGTPHQCAIDGALARHGLSAGGLGLLDFGHIPLADQPGPGPFPVTVAPRFDGGCPLGDTDTLTLYYRVASGPWMGAPMTPAGAGRYVGEIPDLPPGAEVAYDVQLWDSALDRVASLSGGRPDLAPGFYVGPQRALWCDDLEGDSGWTATRAGSGELDWSRGAPQGLGGDPGAAASGAFAYGTRFGEEGSEGPFPGQYHPDLRQTLLSPLLDVTGARQLRVTYARALTVEDGSFDQARALAQGETLWQNVGTPGGTFHTQDRGWRRHGLSAWQLDGRTNAQVSFSLSSDGAVELGGWNVDDVCVWAPEGLDGRYRAQITSVARRAEGGAVVEGVAPFALPLERVLLYRHVGGPVPDSLVGTEVASLEDPSPGQALRLVDPAPPSGEVYYRLFAFDGRYRWPTVPGEDGEDGRLPDPTPSPTEAPTVTPTEGARTESGGCGGGGAAFILPLMGLGWRRRGGAGAQG